MRTPWRTTGAFLAFVACAGGALAQSERPSGAHRLVRQWDFEDELADLKTLPDFWFRHIVEPAGDQRSPFPAFNESRFAREAHNGGEWVVALPVRGGSTRLVLAGGVVPVIPGAKYLVSSAVRTDSIVHARARLTMEFLDGELRTVGESASTPGVRTSGEWDRIRVDGFAPEGSAWMRLSLEALQPHEQVSATLEPHVVAGEDVDGVAYFDDLYVYQIPQITLSTAHVGNVAVGTEGVQLELRLRDLTGEPLLSEIAIFDLEGNVVDRMINPVRDNGRKTVWTPKLESHGWYRASLRVANRTGIVAQRYLDFAWVASDDGLDPFKARRFGVVLEPPTVASLAELPELLDATASGSVSVPVWGARPIEPMTTSANDPRAMRADADDALAYAVERLLDDGRSIAFALTRVPEDLAVRERIDRSDVLGMLSKDVDTWLPSLRPLLTRFGERVLRWEVGRAEEGQPILESTVFEDAQGVAGVLRELVPRPELSLSWSVHQSPEDLEIVPEAVRLTMPTWAGDRAAREYLSGWDPETEVRVHIAELDTEHYGVRQAIVDLSRKAIAAWQSGADQVSIDQPWHERGTGADRIVSPDPLLPAWRTLVTVLAPRLPIGLLPARDGLSVLIAGHELPDRGVLIAWNRTAPQNDARVRGYYGPGPFQLRDIFGNTSPIPTNSRGEIDVPLGDLPVFIEGVDTELAMFHATIGIDPPLLQSRAERHPVEIVLTNPWDTTLSGTLRFAPPEGWEISPTLYSFSIAPGEERRLPASVMFGLNTLAGPFVLDAELELNAGRRYPPIRIPVHGEIGLDELRLDASARVAAVGGGAFDDVIATAVITNLSTLDITLETFAAAPGMATQQNTMIIGPGQSVTNQFTFENAADQLQGQKIAVGLRERPGTGRLNKLVELP